MCGWPDVCSCEGPFVCGRCRRDDAWHLENEQPREMTRTEEQEDLLNAANDQRWPAIMADKS